jgi:hypothetical protein
MRDRRRFLVPRQGDDRRSVLAADSVAVAVESVGIGADDADVRVRDVRAVEVRVARRLGGLAVEDCRRAA